MSFDNIKNSFQAYDNDFGLGHNGVRVSLNYFDGIPDQNLLNSLGSNELRLIFKSLLKRDDTTKEKAITDLNLLIDVDIENKTGSNSQFNNDIFLICWSQMYAKLITNELKSIRLASNSFTIKLIKLLNKHISKFLKDFLPFVFLGTCDTDNIVSKNCKEEFSNCFNNDSNKLNSLWKVFHEPILNLINDIIVKETIDTISDERYISKEESQFKYNRLSTSSINLLILIINANKDTYVKGDLKNVYEDILSDDSLWTAFNLKNTHNLKLYRSILNLIAILFKTKFFKYNKDIFKIALRKLFKSMTQINTRNIVNINPIVPSIMQLLIELSDYKEGRIWSYDKDSKQKLLLFLKITSKTVLPGYFNELYQLYNVTKPLELLDYEHEWLSVWETSLDELNDKPFLGRHGAESLTEFWNNYNKILNEQEGSNNDLLQSSILKTLKNGNSLRNLPELNNIIARVCDSLQLENEFEDYLIELNNDQSNKHKFYLDNMVALLFACPSNEEALLKLTKFINKQLSEESSTQEVQLELLQVCESLIKSDFLFLNDEISKIIFKIPTWIEVSTYKTFSKIIIAYCNSLFVEQNTDWLSSLQEFFTLSATLNIEISEIIGLLDLINDKCYRKLISSDDALKELVENYVKNYSFQGNTPQLFASHILNEDLLKCLFDNVEDNNQIQKFVEYTKYLSDDLKNYLLVNTSFLTGSMFTISNEVTQNAYDLVVPVIKQDNNQDNLILKNICAIIMNYIKGVDDITNVINLSDSICLKIANDILDINPDAINIFIPSDIDNFFVEYIPSIDSRVALINSLSTTTYLLPIDHKALDITKWFELIKIGLFLDRLIPDKDNILTDEILVFFTMLAEVANDYNSITSSPDTRLDEFAHSLFKFPNSKHITLEQIIHSIDTEAGYSNDCLSLMLNDTHPVTAFYKSRILYKLLLNELDFISTSTLISSIPAIETYVTKTVRSSELNVSRYLISSVLLSLLSKVGNNEALVKIRTLLAADSIGIRGSELLSEQNKTKHSLILLTDMLQIDKEQIDIAKFVPIVAQRLSMILKTVNQWLDSDIIYESRFMGMRLVLLRLFSLLVSFPTVAEMNNSIFDIIGKLLVDSLSMCQLDDTPYLLNLRLASLQLYESTIENEVSELFTVDYEQDLIDSLIELNFIEFKYEADNQISIKSYRTLFNIIKTSIKLKQLVPYYDRFLEAFVSSGNKHMCINQKRVITLVLGRIIKERQQNQVIEFELKQQQLHPHTDEDNDQFFDANEDIDDINDSKNIEDDEFKIPDELIKKLNTDIPNEYLEYSNESNFILYLWNWHLTLQYFENISYKMRQVYIDQLKEDDLINKMFDFVSDQINLDDVNFYKEQLKLYDIGHYKKMENEFMNYKEDVSDECKYLLVHLMYELFNNVGSLTSSWFLNIRDRSLQNKIENFVSQFISPLLISTEVENVSRKIADLEGKDDALAIKINKVTNELKASYLIDEQKLEISFKLPNNYPLNNVQVIGVSRVGITEQKWKQWIMSTQHVITGMNGTVLDSLELFTKNVHLQFSGFEECAICYSILHAVDRKLPTKVCPTCKNRFHSACLYKWFRSSGNNTCPLCRGEIPFRK